MKIVKKALSFLVNLISILVIVLAIVMLTSVVMSRGGGTPNVFGFSFFRVLSGSMAPALPTDSLVIVRRCEPEQIAEGDVISFYSSDPSLGGAVNTHRVVGISREDGKLVFETRGDANYIPDKYPVRADNVIGVMVFQSLWLGKALRLIANPLIFLPLIILPLLALLISNLIKAAKLTGNVMRQEEAEAVEEYRSALRAKREQEEQAAAADEPAEQPPDPIE